MGMGGRGKQDGGVNGRRRNWKSDDAAARERRTHTLTHTQTHTHTHTNSLTKRERERERLEFSIKNDVPSVGVCHCEFIASSPHAKVAASRRPRSTDAVISRRRQRASVLHGKNDDVVPRFTEFQHFDSITNQLKVSLQIQFSISSTAFSVTEFLWFDRVPYVLVGFLWVLLSGTAFYLVLPGFVWFFLWLYWVLLGFYRVSLGFTGFY